MPSAKASLYALGLAAGSVANAASCDIYKQGGTPCIAAHSTTRALYNSYSGPLYQVIRGSDGRTTDIHPHSAGGIANANAQDSFCHGTTCLISIIYDQSGRSNDLTRAPKGSAGPGPDHDGLDWQAGATGAPVTLKGQKAYGVFVSPGTGYRKMLGNGAATGDEAEGMYAVVDGTHYNNKCCFDYGNAEPSSIDTGNGHMEALYFGNAGGPDSSGPWVMADLENGLYLTERINERPPNRNISHRFVTATLKGEPHHWAMRGGDATGGGLQSVYNGKRPENGYDPMHKEGSIILGIGGDNSNSAQGTFYEGVMTQGYPSDATEDKVQADITSQKYAVGQMNSGPAIRVGSTVSFRATTSCCTNRYIARDAGSQDVKIDFTNDDGAKRRASWIVHQGLGNSACYSFESVDQRGSYIRHYANGLRVNKPDGSKLFTEDATFCAQDGLNGQGSTIRSWSQPSRFWRHFDARLYIAGNGGPYAFDNKRSYNDDASFVVGGGLA